MHVQCVYVYYGYTIIRSNDIVRYSKKEVEKEVER